MNVKFFLSWSTIWPYQVTGDVMQQCTFWPSSPHLPYHLLSATDLTPKLVPMSRWLVLICATLTGMPTDCCWKQAAFTLQCPFSGDIFQCSTTCVSFLSFIGISWITWQCVLVILKVNMLVYLYNYVWHLVTIINLRTSMLLDSVLFTSVYHEW